MVNVSMLTDQIPNKSRANEFLYCLNCGQRYSANRGDYFLASLQHEFTCECGEPMILAKTEGAEIHGIWQIVIKQVQ